MSIDSILYPLIKKKPLLVAKHKFWNAAGDSYRTLKEQAVKQQTDMLLMSKFEQDDNSKQGFCMYRTLVPINAVIPLITKTNAALCEQLVTYPRKAYFDIDLDLTKPDNAGKVLDLSILFNVLQEYFSLEPEDVSVYGYETSSKVSYHVVARKHVLRDGEELKTFKRMVNLVKNEYGYSWFDDGVYGDGQSFKCPFQSKPGKDITLPLHPKQNYQVSDLLVSTPFVAPNSIPYFSVVLPPQVTVNPKKGGAVVRSQHQMKVDQLPLPSSLVSNSDAWDPKVLLGITPNPLASDAGWNRHRYIAALFAVSNGLTQNDYMNWITHSEWYTQAVNQVERYTKAEETYKAASKYVLYNTQHKDNKYKTSCKYTIESYRHHLAQWYKDFADTNHNTPYFVDSFNLPIEQIPIDGYIKSEHFSVSQKAVVFNICMGGGKTTATLQYLKDNGHMNFVWLAPRQTLVANTSYRCDVEYQIKHTSHLKVQTKKSLLAEADKLLICNQSLHYLRGTTFDIVVIDEIETVLQSWLDDDTHKKKLEPNFNQYVTLMQNASKIILLDAFITTKTLNHLKDMGIHADNIICYTSSLKPPTRTLIPNKTYNEILDKIIDAVVKKEKCYVFYAYKNSTTTHQKIEDVDRTIKMGVQKQLADAATTPEEALKVYRRGLDDICTSCLYFSESEAKNKLGNINQLWSDADYVLTTSSITVGVNYEQADYDHVFIIGAGSVNLPRDIIQSSMRIRKPKCPDINTFFFDEKPKDIKKRPHFYGKGNAIYDNLVNMNLKEYHADFKESLGKFCELTNYVVDEEFYKVRNHKVSSFKNELHISANLREFTDVKVISHDMCEALEKRIYGGSASVDERVMVDKYYFVERNKYLTHEERVEIWNDNREKFLMGCKYSRLVSMLLEDNSVHSLADLDPNRMLFGVTLKEYVEKTYSIYKASHPRHSIINALNVELGYHAFNMKTDKNRNTVYVHNKGLKRLCEVYLMSTERAEQEKLAAEQANDYDAEPIEVKLPRKQAIAAWNLEYGKHLKDEDYITIEDVHGDEVTTYKYLHPWERSKKYYRLTVEEWLNDRKLRPIPITYENIGRFEKKNPPYYPLNRHIPRALPMYPTVIYTATD